MDNGKLTDKDRNVLSDKEKEINIKANDTSFKYMYIYLLFLIFYEYIKNSNLSYDLFSVFFVSQLIKSLYKYLKLKDKIYLFECIGSFIMGELSKLPNIGKEVERQLNEVGIFTYDELKATGAEQTWLKIQEIDPSACIHRLLALEGAIHGVKKTELSQKRKEDLKDFYNWNKGK